MSEFKGKVEFKWLHGCGQSPKNNSGTTGSRNCILAQAPPIPDGEAEAQRGDRTCPRSHSRRARKATRADRVELSPAAPTCLRCTHLPGSVLVTQSPCLPCPAQAGPRPSSILATSELTFITFSTFFPRTRFGLSAELCPQLHVSAHLPTFIPFQKVPQPLPFRDTADLGSNCGPAMDPDA